MKSFVIASAFALVWADDAPSDHASHGDSPLKTDITILKEEMNALEHAHGITAGTDAWDSADLDNIDSTLLNSVSDGGDFYQTFATPKDGFQSPVGEQAGCLLDKSAHILEFHFCTSQQESKFGTAVEQNCAQKDSGYLKTTLEEMTECCTGLAHLPQWDEMVDCRTLLDPHTKKLENKVDAWDKCTSAAAKLLGDDSAEHGEAFNSDECNEAAKAVPELVMGVHNVALTLYVKEHHLDLTKLAAHFLTVCEPNKLTEHVLHEHSERLKHKMHEHHAKASRAHLKKHAHRRLIASADPVDTNAPPTPSPMAGKVAELREGDDPFRADILKTFGFRCYMLLRDLWEAQDEGKKYERAEKLNWDYDD
jgi:hypothetical protein